MTEIQQGAKSAIMPATTAAITEPPKKMLLSTASHVPEIFADESMQWKLPLRVRYRTATKFLQPVHPWQASPARVIYYKTIVPTIT
jgi:hypothetical protein